MKINRLLALAVMTGALPCAAAAAGAVVVSGVREPRGEIVISGPARSAQGLNEELFRIRADGSARYRLTRNGSMDGEADVDAGGRWVVFARYMSGTVYGFITLWIMDADGGRLRKLFDSREFSPEWPRWSPSGRWIAFQSQCEFGSSDKPTDTCIELSIIRPDASEERSLGRTITGGSRESVGSGTAWSWSRDDRWIAFERPTSEMSDRLEVAIVDVDTREVRVVTPGAQPTFSPRSLDLAVVKGRRIALVRPDGSFVGWVSKTPPGWRDHVPSWSPDGQQMAFWRTRLDGEATKLTIVRMTSRRVRTVVLHDPEFRRIVWSPDGSCVAVTDRRAVKSSYAPWSYRIEVGAEEEPLLIARGSVEDWARPTR